jgi:hypothetical protein
MVFKDGTKYDGNWVKGKQHGAGTLYDLGGKIKQGNWQNGVIVTPI